MTNTKPTIFSGVQPTGNLHLGNYLGAISQWVPLQDQYRSIFCVVDYHAITVKQDPKDLNQRILEIIKHYLAAGIDPKKALLFQQSDITEHTELAWILNTITHTGDLTKMTQFKDKTKFDFDYYISDKFMEVANFDRYKNLSFRDSLPIFLPALIKDFKEKFNSTGVGLFDYPVLMAADILLYDTDAVPVGEDQKQHVELCRDLAKRFNHHYGPTFKIPEVIMRKEGARIMGLDDPTKKMSKSAKSAASYIALNDAPEVAAKKIMRAVTDSGSEIVFDRTDKPAIANLLTIYHLLSGQEIKDIVAAYKGKGYGDFKKGLAEEVKKFLVTYQAKFNAISDAEVKRVLKDGAERLGPIARATLERTKERLGLHIKK